MGSHPWTMIGCPRLNFILISQGKGKDTDTSLSLARLGVALQITPCTPLGHARKARVNAGLLFVLSIHVSVAPMENCIRGQAEDKTRKEEAILLESCCSSQLTALVQARER